MLLIDIIFFILSIGLILLASHFLVQQACLLGKHLNWPESLIGIVILGIGTSMPEIMISLYSHLHNHEGLFLGNILGSNIANSTLILGIALLFAQHTSAPFRTLCRPFSFMVISSLLLVVMIADKTLNVWEALILVVLAIASLIHYQPTAKPHDTTSRPSFCKVIKYSCIIAGLLGLIFVGAHITVNCGLQIATTLHLSETAFGALFIAFTTSLPEMAVAAVAAKQKRLPLAVSTIIGSNTANIGLAIGLSALLKPIVLHSYQLLPIAGVMLLCSLLLPFWGNNSSHLHVAKGIILIALYGAFIAWIAW